MNENQIINMAASQSTTRGTGQPQSDEAKQKRVQWLSYLKAHLDVIAITLTITYLTYSIYKLKKENR